MSSGGIRDDASRLRLPFPKPPGGDGDSDTGTKAAGGSAPFSLRLTVGERAALQAAAGSVPLGTYIRTRLLDGSAAPRRAHRRPAQDDALIARLLAQLGQSRLAGNLNQLARAAHIGALPVTPEVASDLRAACADIRAMRFDLVRALGLQEGAPS